MRGEVVASGLAPSKPHHAAGAVNFADEYSPNWSRWPLVQVELHGRKGFARLRTP
jgi:hypothetical protein